MSEVQTVITTVYDGVNDVNVSIAQGTIERISLKRINEDGSPKVTNINKGPNAGKVINSTHRASILLKQGEDQVWVSFGSHEVKNLAYEHQYQIKVDEKWTDLKEGMVIRCPVQIRTWKDARTGEDRSAPEGKKAKIKITDASGAREPRQAGGPQTSSATSNTSGGKTTKVYGEILSLSDTGAVVKDENGNEVSVVLTKEQIGQVQVGGRLAGQRGEDGSVSGFKAYGPKGSGGSSGSAGGSKGGFKKDNSGMETGHALNGALNLRRSGLTAPPVVEVAKVVHDVTKHLKLDAAQDPANKGMSDYDLGAMVGHAVLNATRDIQVGDNDNQEEITGKLLAYARELMSSVVPGVAAYVKGENLSSTADGKPDPQLEPKVEDAVQQKVQPDGHINMTPEIMDFDDDVPFAPICLMYPNHAIYAL